MFFRDEFKEIKKALNKLNLLHTSSLNENILISKYNSLFSDLELDSKLTNPQKQLELNELKKAVNTLKKALLRHPDFDNYLFENNNDKKFNPICKRIIKFLLNLLIKFLKIIKIIFLIIWTKINFKNIKVMKIDFHIFKNFFEKLSSNKFYHIPISFLFFLTLGLVSQLYLISSKNEKIQQKENPIQKVTSPEFYFYISSPVGGFINVIDSNKNVLTQLPHSLKVKTEESCKSNVEYCFLPSINAQVPRKFLSEVQPLPEIAILNLQKDVLVAGNKTSSKQYFSFQNEKVIFISNKVKEEGIIEIDKEFIYLIFDSKKFKLKFLKLGKFKIVE